MKWQPIETAPTDGTRILLRGRNGRIADGHYGQPDGFANPKRFVWPYINATPTHWAPLALIAAAPELLEELKNLHRNYVNLLEAGRDRIVALGGDCDPVDRMEQDDPHLRAAKAVIAKATA